MRRLTIRFGGNTRQFLTPLLSIARRRTESPLQFERLWPSLCLDNRSIHRVRSGVSRDVDRHEGATMHAAGELAS